MSRPPTHVEIIHRLRDAASYEFGNLTPGQQELYRAAADAIDRLRGLAAEVIDDLEDTCDCDGHVADIAGYRGRLDGD